MSSSLAITSLDLGPQRRAMYSAALFTKYWGLIMADTPQVTSTDDSENTNKRGRAAIWAACIIAALTVYFASVGPAYRMTGFQLNGIRPASRSQLACEAVYLPICFACRHSTVIRDGVSSYLGLWKRSARRVP